ncbi:DUF4236 domain-containing protein [Candidatus Parcubacteria bacterium]|nr:MAG: DUF4236 domain-containing protein [Candidatus Parcubacteria bacterium]
MGFRFRKSIKIAPGVRVNVGKRGVSSISVGKTNIGKRGVYQNINIPGTGVSYRAKIGGGTPRRKTRASRSKTKKEVLQVTLKLLEDGTLIFEDSKGHPLPEALVREAKRQQRSSIEAWLEEQCHKYNANHQELLNIHLATPPPEGKVIVNPKPRPPRLQKPGIMAKIFKGYRKRIEEKNKAAQQEYLKALERWKRAEESLRTDVEVMEQVLGKALSSLQWPRETIVNFEIVDDGRKVLVDVDLPEIEDMPTKEAKVNRRNLRLTIRERSQKQIRLDYLWHIHAVGFRIIGEIFAHLPSVEMVVLSAYSQRVDKRTGTVKDDYLYSVRVLRDEWREINFSNLKALDVVASFDRFEVRRKITKTGVISAIEPFEQ